MSPRDGVEDVVVAGAGPIGLAGAIAARRRGLDPLVTDAGSNADSIRRHREGHDLLPVFIESGRFDGEMISGPRGRSPGS